MSSSSTYAVFPASRPRLESPRRFAAPRAAHEGDGGDGAEPSERPTDVQRRALNGARKWVIAGIDVDERVDSLWGESMTASCEVTVRLPEGDSSWEVPGKSTTSVRARVVCAGGGPDRSGNDYELIAHLGEGGMGMVYAARQAAIDRHIALKMIKPELRRRRAMRRSKFLAEAAVTGDLDHPNVVPIYDLGTAPTAGCSTP